MQVSNSGRAVVLFSPKKNKKSNEIETKSIAVELVTCRC